MKNFNQKLYIFLFKLKLYFSNKASNCVNLYHDHIINLVNVIDVVSYSL